ncbi:NAD-specific glutamate dehydrogenase [Paraburkholderia tropica]
MSAGRNARVRSLAATARGRRSRRLADFRSEQRRERAACVFFGERHAAAEVRELVLADLADGEIRAVRMREIEARDARRRQHRQRFGHAHADLVGLQHVEHVALDEVVRAGRIAGRRTDARVLLGDQRVVVERLARRIAPQVAAHACVHRLGERFRETVGERLEHDRAVVVVILLELRFLHVHANARGDREHADVVGLARVLRSDEVGETAVRAHHAVHHRTHRLLAQIAPRHRDFRARVVGVDLDVVVVDGVRGQERDHAVRLQPAALDQAREHRPGVGGHLARRLADDLVVEDLRIRTGQIPGLEERAPVDVLRQLVQVVVLEHAAADELRLHGFEAGPVDLRLVGARGFERDHRLRLLVGVLLANAVVIGLEFVDVLRRAFVGQQARRHRHRARRVRHVHDRAFVVRRDLHGRVHARGGRAADQQRNLLHAEIVVALHFARDVGHLFERRRDEAGQTDDVRALDLRLRENLVARDHHAHVDHFEVVALEHDRHDVLADVVHVALHGRDDDLALRAHVRARFGEQTLFFLDERNQVRDGLLHHARRLHHLRQEHLALAEQVADDVHAVHQRAFDHVDRTAAAAHDLLARFLGIFDDEVRDAVHERMRKTLLDVLIAPLQVLFLLRRAGLELVGDFEQTVGGVVAAIEHHVFDALAQFGVEIGIHAELARVHDAHVHASLDGVVEEHGVDRLAHRVVAAERERHVRDAAADLRVRQVLLDPARGFDEVHRVVVVFLDARGDREDVRVEDDVFGQEADFVHEHVVRALADLDLALIRVGLAGFVERHHHGRRAVTADQLRVMDERLLAFLERDRVDDGLALHALQARFDHVPLRRIDHDRHARDVGLGGDQIHEAHHRRFRIEHRLVHVDVDDLRAVFDLLARDCERLVELAVENHARERLRAGHVGALAHVDEQRAVRHVERFEAGESQGMVSHGGGPGRQGSSVCRLRVAGRVGASYSTSRYWPGQRRGLISASAFAMAAMCSGVVPQQPPATFTRPAVANSFRSPEVSAGSSSKPVSLIGFGRPAFG